jgi:hypothetical protein
MSRNRTATGHTKPWKPRAGMASASRGPLHLLDTTLTEVSKLCPCKPGQKQPLQMLSFIYSGTVLVRREGRELQPQTWVKARPPQNCPSDPHRKQPYRPRTAGPNAQRLKGAKELRGVGAQGALAPIVEFVFMPEKCGVWTQVGRVRTRHDTYAGIRWPVWMQALLGTADVACIHVVTSYVYIRYITAI